MNFNELFQKMRDLDQPVQELVGGQEKLDVDNDGDIQGDDLADLRSGKDKEVDECGMGMGMPPSGQSDSVSMNVSMNGSGAGGIRDLLDVLKNLDGGSDAHGDAHDLGDLISKMDGPEMPMNKPVVVGDSSPVDEYANEPDEMYAPASAVTPTGNDMHSKGAEFPKVNGGGNPMTMEGLFSRLDNLYQEIKSR